MFTVIDSFAALATVLVVESDASHDHRQLLQLSVLVSLLQRQECTQLRLRENTLKSRCKHIPIPLCLVKLLTR